MPTDPHRLVVRSDTGEPARTVAIFFWPVLRSEEPFVHLSLGISDETGEIAEARLLPPGEYELFTTPGQHHTALNSGDAGRPYYDYRSLGRITWPRDGKPKTIEVRLPADDSQSR